ncbi:MAG: hypothetical protein RSB70_02195 [Clostridium sp.]
MKSKKIRVVILFIIIISVGFGIYFLKSENGSKSENLANINAYVKPLHLGCSIRVKISDEGVKNYEDAHYFQVAIDGNLASAICELGQGTTTYPSKGPRDVVEVKVLNSDKEEIDSVKVKLEQENQ